MQLDSLYNQLVEDFELISLSHEDREEMLLEITKTIHKQFLVDVYQVLGEEKFEALKQSANMGDEFYFTTLKHLVPDYESLYESAKDKVREKFKGI